MPNCGIVDIGSNTIRLSVYRYDGGSFRLLLGQTENAGLAGYVRDGALTAEGIGRCANTLCGFQRLLADLGIEERYAFATASLRNTVNAEEAASEIEVVSGVPVTILSGEDEARLSFLGAIQNIPPSETPGLLADIGGGSTELVVYEKNAVRHADSLPIGSLNLFRQYVSGILPTAEELSLICRQVHGALETRSPLPCSHLLGVGGTIRTAGRLLGYRPGQSFSAGEVFSLCQRLKVRDRETLARLLEVSAERVHTLLPGLTILTAVLEAYDVDTVTLSAQSIREGYLIKYVLTKAHQEVSG